MYVCGISMDVFDSNHNNFIIIMQGIYLESNNTNPESKVRGDNMGPIWGRHALSRDI